LELKKGNVDAMLRRMTARQWMEWLTLRSLHAFGYEREGFRIAQIVKALWDVRYSGTKKQNPNSLYDYANELLFGDEEPKRGRAPSRMQSPQQQGQVLRAIFGELVKAKKKGSKQ
jgi:hypothetical protein